MKACDGAKPSKTGIGRTFKRVGKVAACIEGTFEMGDKCASIAFTKTVKSLPEAWAVAGCMPERAVDECAFISSRDSFYIASVSETGWLYVQFRGGPPGFLRVLDEKTLGFADFCGNRQYVTTGNVATDDRVSLFLMDYAASRSLEGCEWSPRARTTSRRNSRRRTILRSSSAPS